MEYIDNFNGTYYSVLECQIEFIKTHPDAILPRKAHDNDSGYDLYAVEDTLIPLNGSNIVKVGIEVASITPGYWFKIEARSGLGFKRSIQPHLGVIDNGYRGDLGVKLYNFNNRDHIIKKGDACAQFVIYKIVNSDVSFVDKKTESDRGVKGFGSTGGV